MSSDPDHDVSQWFQLRPCFSENEGFNDSRLNEEGVHTVLFRSKSTGITSTDDRKAFEKHLPSIIQTVRSVRTFPTTVRVQTDLDKGSEKKRISLVVRPIPFLSAYEPQP